MMRRVVATALPCLALLTACTGHHSPTPTPSTGAAADERRALTVQRFVDEPVPGSPAWKTDSSPLGRIWRAYYPGIGEFTLNDSGQTVLTAVLAPPGGAAGPALSQQVLLNRAEAYAMAHVPTLRKLTLFRQYRGVSSYSATWRERRGQAWLPQLVSVTVRTDGRVLAFIHNPTTTPTINTTPAVSSTAAVSAAQRIVGASVSVDPHPQLAVVGPPTRSAVLVWIVTANVGTGGGSPAPEQVLIDARSGKPIR